MVSAGLGFWVAFHLFVVGMLALDLAVLQRHAHVVSKKEALAWSIVWVACALAFAFGIEVTVGAEKSLEFVTGYLIEKALSVDNLFVFLLIFGSFSVPPELQRRVLLWGVLGALVMRAGFILAGTALIRAFHWLTYLLGAVLLVTAVRMVREHEARIDPGQHPVVKFLCRWLPVTGQYEGEHFLVRRGRRWMATPLLVVLAVVESSDLVFAMDSIPAIFAITLDPFVVYTSNVFAILGLRALFFLLAGMMADLRYLREGLAVVLGFVGIKMVASDFIEIPILLSLGFIAVTLAVAVAASLRLPVPRQAVPCHGEQGPPGPGGLVS